MADDTQHEDQGISARAQSGRELCLPSTIDLGSLFELENDLPDELIPNGDLGLGMPSNGGGAGVWRGWSRTQPPSTSSSPSS
ncbi:hypothetical protein COCON_G00208030 [Conger conger]|uniref:Uncharacterized protein n=1 Tax=Conger conger TaxID=82655 RepID=A0A9Q1D078_CONCO|nr:hypothetical protein COCON_G00208030 [Conger conger]